jgi:radical SAM protein with 4Fe4S-binding SPASM domain
MSFTLMRSNLQELPLFIQKAAKAGVDSIGCRHLEVYHPDMENESLFNHKAYFNSIRAASMELAKSLKITLLIGEELWNHPAAGGCAPCLIPWDSSVVLANGDVMACCAPGSKMGNVNEQSLEAIWPGAGYQRLRERVNSVDPPNLCKACQFRVALQRVHEFCGAGPGDPSACREFPLRALAHAGRRIHDSATAGRHHRAFWTGTQGWQSWWSWPPEGFS